MDSAWLGVEKVVAAAAGALHTELAARVEEAVGTGGADVSAASGAANADANDDNDANTDNENDADKDNDNNAENSADNDNDTDDDNDTDADNDNDTGNDPGTSGSAVKVGAVEGGAVKGGAVKGGAVKGKAPSTRCFQIFGLDVMLDQDLRPHLLEVPLIDCANNRLNY
jgi:hypothetical protein